MYKQDIVRGQNKLTYYVITEVCIMFIHNSQYEKTKESFQERQTANEQ